MISPNLHLINPAHMLLKLTIIIINPNQNNFTRIFLQTFNILPVLLLMCDKEVVEV